MRFQQYTAPVQAKGIEDTAFYRYNVLLSLNEVGGDPGRFGRSVAEFHQANSHRLAHWPAEMNASATHDTKRGEDARARLNVLSELPTEWREAASQWIRMNRQLRMVVDEEPAPDRSDEYHFYQALLSVWPAEGEEEPLPREASGDVVRRLTDYMTKAVREAKVHTSWVNPNVAYEAAVTSFVERVLTGERAERFLGAFVPFARRVGRFGMTNSLAQVVLKLASPGVPDFYQGTEFWNLTLVDPDNRGAVDYGARRVALEGLERTLAPTGVDRYTPDDGADQKAAVAALLRAWPDGRIKLFVTSAGLRLRKARPDLFLHGEYRPLMADGWGGKRLVACARADSEHVLIAVAPRLAASLCDPGSAFPTGSEAWRDTRLALPPEWSGLVFRDLLTGTTIAPAQAGANPWIAVATILSTCPVALLWAGRSVSSAGGSRHE
jgi:(1->4)-alpha-D-glucan 1-alpha-D-glucosylmutase